jgi:hypothetical protein
MLVAALLLSLVLTGLPAIAAGLTVEATKDSFTLVSIEPAEDGKTVSLQCSAACRYEDEKTIVLAGRFKKKTNYTIVLPEGFVSNGRPYKATLTAFQFGSLPPKIEFADTRTVIERNSRQMLHTSLINVDELVLKGLSLPPVMAPMALAITEMKDKAGTTNPAGKLKKAKKRSRAPGNEQEHVLLSNESFDDLSGKLTTLYLALRSQLEAKGIPPIFLGNFVQYSQVFLSPLDPDQRKQFSVPLTFRTEKEKGAIELISLSGKDSVGRGAAVARIFRITDIGITYKVSAEGLLVWTTSIGTGKPLASVRCLGYLKDGTFADLGTTDDHGILLLKAIDPKSRIILPLITAKPAASPVPSDVVAVLAGTTDDVTYVAIDNSTVLNLNGIDRSDPREKQIPLLKGSVFTERGMYRPGEKVYFKGTVRQYRDKGVNLPLIKKVRFTVINSKNETIYNHEQVLSEFGTTADSLNIEPYYPLGTYTIKMLPEGSREETASFEVQEFKAPRHFVELDFKRATKKAEGYVNIERTVDILTCTIRGKYYAGGPVKNGKVRWKVAYTNTSFSRKEFPDYAFGNAAGAPQGIIESGETTLDEKGVATVSLPVAREVAAGLYGVEMTASVVDFDGKVSTETATHQVEPAYLIGISPHRTSIERGDSQALRLVVLSRKGSRIQQGSLTAEIMRRDYTYILKRNDQGNAYWEQNEVFMKETSVSLKIAKGSAAFDFDFTRAGTYLVKFTFKTKDGKSYVSSTQLDVDYGSYRYYDNDENSKFERLSVQTDKTTYAMGETMRVYVGARKTLASLLMTIEREGILEHSLVTLKPNQKYIDIPVQERFGPNVYISFFGITARGEFPLHSTTFDAAAPDFLFGTTKVAIRQKPGTLTIAVNPEEKQLVAEPGTSVTLNISSRDYEGKGVETEMALAVVDESVLALTRFQTPSLESLGTFTVPLGVLTGELRTELLKQTPYGFMKNKKLTGGDGGGGEDVEGKLRRDFRPVAYFNPMLRTGADGTAQVSFTLPDSMTTYRVYVVACDRKDRFASFQRPLLVKRDFYIEPGIPRFFTKGDRFTFFVSAFNKTDSAGQMRFNIKSDPQLALSADSTIALDAQDRLLVPVKGEAMQAGLSTFRLSGSFMDRKDSVELKLPVKSGYIRWNDVLYGTMQGDSVIKYEFPSKDTIWSGVDPNEVQALLTLSSSPFFRLSQGIKYLLAYPYGCVEQTSSRVIPLAALRNLIRDGFISEITTEDADKFLKPGIERLLSMQVGSGGFAYWPGQREASPWGSVYAVTALTRARMAGIEVPAFRMDSALNYLARTVKEGDKRAATENAFALYLLALNGKLDKELFMDVYKNFDKMPRQGGLLMMLAAQASGHLLTGEIADRTKSLLGKTVSSDYDEFYAVHREPAIALMAANVILKDDALAGKLAQGLLDNVNSEGRWGSTSDTGWALLALGEYFKGKSFSSKPVEVTVDQTGQTPVKAKVLPNIPFTKKLDAGAFLASPTVRVAAPQAIDIAYSLSITLPRVDWAGKGASNGLKVAKRIENIEGGSTIRVGDIVRVTVAIQSQGTYNYVVLDDPLPAGFVAINTAIKTEEQVSKKRGSRNDEEGDESGEESGIQEEGDAAVSSDQDFDVWGNAYSFYPNHFELRDDRVLAFRNRLWSGVYEYSYYARAVCEGEFVMPQTKAQLMYRPDVVGYTPMSIVTIKPRK